MERKKFLRNLAVTATSFPLLIAAAYKQSNQHTLNIKETDCDDPITPPVNEGPFYVNEKLNRSNIAEMKTGIPLTLIFKVEDVHCNPIQGAVIDIWHCDKNGLYSDENQQNTKGQKWLRGYQTTDINGKCTFQTIFPGWYDGRLTHIHGKLRVGDAIKQTTNFFIPKHIEEEVFATPLYTKGQNPITVEQDIELRGDHKSYNTLMMSVTGDVIKGYVATYTIAFI
jgi:protocatechuate 3,4-dioxygenase beta subunit